MQNCEWVFEDGKPMIFKEQIGNSRSMTYIFYSPISGKEIAIKQYD